MSLDEQLEHDYIIAYKAKDTVRLSVLRMLKTVMKNYQVEHLKKPDESAILDIIVKQCKQRQDSIEQFTAANRPELAEKEAAELEVLRSYMPSPLSQEELTEIINTLIHQLGATSIKDMGKVMQALTAEYKGRFDGQAASNGVRNALQSL